MKLDFLLRILMKKNWQLLKKNLKKLVGDTAFNNWLKQLSFISIEEN